MPKVAIFAGIINIVTMFINNIFLDSKKLKELEITYQNAVCICILDIAKFVDFR